MPIDFNININEELEDGTVNTRIVKASVLSEPGEITLKRWASYFEAVSKKPEWFRKFHNATTEEEKNALQAEWTPEQWAESYGIFSRICLLFVDGVGVDELAELPIGDGSEGTNSLFGLLLIIISNVYGYKPQTREFFEWKGRKFKAFIPKNIAGQEMPGADMTVRDAVTAFQLEHAWNQYDGSTEYNINRGVLAALVREIKDGKVVKPPVDGPGLAQYQFEKEKLFDDITMDIALDVVFFSLRLRALSIRIPLSVSCLLHPVTED